MTEYYGFEQKFPLLKTGRTHFFMTPPGPNPPPAAGEVVTIVQPPAPGSDQPATARTVQVVNADASGRVTGKDTDSSGVVTATDVTGTVVTPQKRFDGNRETAGIADAPPPPADLAAANRARDTRRDAVSSHLTGLDSDSSAPGIQVHGLTVPEVADPNDQARAVRTAMDAEIVRLRGLDPSAATLSDDDRAKLGQLDQLVAARRTLNGRIESFEAASDQANLFVTPGSKTAAELADAGQIERLYDPTRYPFEGEIPTTHQGELDRTSSLDDMRGSYTLLRKMAENAGLPDFNGLPVLAPDATETDIIAAYQALESRGLALTTTLDHNEDNPLLSDHASRIGGVRVLLHEVSGRLARFETANTRLDEARRLFTLTKDMTPTTPGIPPSANNTTLAAGALEDILSGSMGNRDGYTNPTSDPAALRAHHGAGATRLGQYMRRQEAELVRLEEVSRSDPNPAVHTQRLDDLNNFRRYMRNVHTRITNDGHALTINDRMRAALTSNNPQSIAAFTNAPLTGGQSVVQRMQAGSYVEALGSMQTADQTAITENRPAPFGTMSASGGQSLGNVARDFTAGTNAITGMINGVSGAVQAGTGLSNSIRGFGASIQGGGYGGYGGYGGGGFDLGSAISGFSAMNSFHECRADSEKAKKLLRQLMMMIMCGNTDAIKFALITMGKITKDQLANFSGLVIKAKMVKLDQMDGLNAEFMKMADTTDGGGEINQARMNQFGLQMQKMVGDLSSLDQILRVNLNALQEALNEADSYLRSVLPQELRRSSWA